MTMPRRAQREPDDAASTTDEPLPSRRRRRTQPPELHITYVPMTEEQHRAAVRALAELLLWAWEERQHRQRAA